MVLAFVGVVAALVAGLSAAPATADGSMPTWPENPNWQQYVESPTSTDVTANAVVSTSGSVTNAGALLKAGTGEATLTAVPGSVQSHPVTVSFPTVDARYVRLDVTKLGLEPAGDPAGVYVQLAELQVFGPQGGTNLALNKGVTASETIQAAGWGTQFLTDGVTNSQNGSAHGYTSQAHSSSDVAANPVWVSINLGSLQSVRSVVLWPRTDTLADNGQTASFPVDYAVQTSTDDATYATQSAVTAQPDPAPATIDNGHASIVLDYGKDVGGYPYFRVASQSGSPTLEAGYSETKTQISETGDGVAPWASGDPRRYDTYSVTAPGLITNNEIQGGERYEQITVTTPGTVSLSAAGITFTPLLATADTYRGYFVSSSDQLNRAWYAGAYTAQLNQLPVGTTRPPWAIQDGALDVPGSATGAGLLTTGSTWTDYTVSFKTKIVTNQSGWMVRASNGSGGQSGYLLILDGAGDTASGPGQNVLQEVSESNGAYRTIANVSLPNPVTVGTWHDVKTVVNGTEVTTYLDGTQVASFDSSTFSGTASFTAGTFGFREYSGEEASFSDLSITSPSGATLYQNALDTPQAISDFDVLGGNTVPLILDGAKRDRAVWSGDLSVEGPTLFYSTNTSDYIKGSLELLGSYTGSNGYVTGDMPPQQPIALTRPVNTAYAYSATYSMYFVRNLALYYEYTGDLSFVKKEWPIAADELAWSAGQVDANGLFATNSGDGADWDYYDGTKTGEVTAYNAMYYQTLLDGAQLAGALGDSGQADQYAASAAALKAAINANLFNPSTGVYDVSNSVRGIVAQDSNVLAIDFGVAPADKIAGILAKIKSTLWTAHGTLPFSSGYTDFISPFVSGYELNARFSAGDTQDALTLLADEWGPMLAPGDNYTGTFWENESTSGGQAWSATSMAHGWSTTPTSALSRYVLGVSPVAAGYDTWLVEPHAGNLAWAEGAVPTPHGDIRVYWSQDSAAGKFAMHVDAPKGTSGTIAIPTFGEHAVIKINGKTVQADADPSGNYADVHVPGGVYNIKVVPAT
jgi:alpha-L-rhamnosidase